MLDVTSYATAPDVLVTRSYATEASFRQEAPVSLRPWMLPIDVSMGVRGLVEPDSKPKS